MTGEPEPVAGKSLGQNLGPWGWLAIFVMIGVLIAAIVYAVYAWNSFTATVSPLGWVFMGMGIVFTIVVGGGLMALVFYSSREGKDF